MHPTFIFRSRDTRDDSLLTAVTDAYEQRGIQVVPATDYAPELLVGPGLLSGRKPSGSEARDIDFGWEIAKRMGALDIGQSITVKDGTVLAVEAVEGTDQCLSRTGDLCRRGGWTLVKVAKPDQDMRFDVPTIGPQTVQGVYDGGGRAIAIEAGRTIVVDYDATVRLADRLGVALVAMDSASMQGVHKDNFIAA